MNIQLKTENQITHAYGTTYTLYELFGGIGIKLYRKLFLNKKSIITRDELSSLGSRCCCGETELVKIKVDKKYCYFFSPKEIIDEFVKNKDWDRVINSMVKVDKNGYVVNISELLYSGCEDIYPYEPITNTDNIIIKIHNLVSERLITLNRYKERKDTFYKKEYDANKLFIEAHITGNCQLSSVIGLNKFLENYNDESVILMDCSLLICKKFTHKNIVMSAHKNKEEMDETIKKLIKPSSVVEVRKKFNFNGITFLMLKWK